MIEVPVVLGMVRGVGASLALFIAMFYWRARENRVMRASAVFFAALGLILLAASALAAAGFVGSWWAVFLSGTVTAALGVLVAALYGRRDGS